MVDPIEVAPGVVIPPSAVTMTAVRASGPGGQNVNKVSSKVDLRVDLRAIRGLDAGARQRLARLAEPRLDGEGRLHVTSQRTRDQAKNLADALEKVCELIVRAMVRPTVRRPTRPTRGSVERRLDAKKRDANTKSGRRGGWDA